MATMKTKAKAGAHIPMRERTAITVYPEPEILKQLDAACDIERRSRGNMVHEILRRYFTKKEEAHADASAAG